MARLPRLDLPHVPQHVIQRGNNRLPCFLADEDYARYKSDLFDAATLCGCAIHAYVLMTNHVHMLVTGATHGAVSRMMQRLGRRYVACFNASYRRTGTLWEGRYKSSLVDTERYLLTCYRYIELNPVRAAMVCDPGEYQWSSYAQNALGKTDRLITPHPCYVSLGKDEEQRLAAYRGLFERAIGDEELAEIRAYVQQQKALGSPRFQAQIAKQLTRKVEVLPRGRPRKALDSDARAAEVTLPNLKMNLTPFSQAARGRMCANTFPNSRRAVSNS